MIRHNASRIELPEKLRYKALRASVFEIASPPITAPSPIASPSPILPSSSGIVATDGNTYDTNGTNNHVYSKASEPLGDTASNTYQNDEMKIPGHVIVGATIFCTGLKVLKNIVAIEKIVEANHVKAPVSDDMPVVKPVWRKV